MISDWGWRERIVYAAVAVVGIVLSYTIVFWFAMAAIENRPVTMFQSLQVVVESITTAGYGGFAPWESPALNLLVLAMNLTGVVLVFLALPAFAIPLLEDAVETTTPTTTALTDHVIICAYSPRHEVLREELESADVPYVFIEEDPDLVRDLYRRGIEAMVGDAGRVETLQNANINHARAIVADIDDEKNPTIILSAKRCNPDLQVISVVNNYEAASYQRYAGADEVVQARQVLGEGLAMRASESLAEDFRAAIGIDAELEVTEILVRDDSELVGQTLKGTDVFDRIGINVIGGWFDGKLVIPPDPGMPIGENTILLVTGELSAGDLEELKTRPLPPHEDENSRVVVCGYGTVGWNTVRRLEAENREACVVDRTAEERVDVVGDVTDRRTLSRANVENARAVVLTLNDDATTIYTVLMLEQLAPDVEIIARANDPDNVWKLYGAGADFVLSLSTMTGEILASLLVHEREILTAQVDFEFVRVGAPSLAGTTLAEADIRAQTGCTVAAVERNGSLVTDLDGAFTIEAGDTLILAGSEKSVDAAMGCFEPRDFSEE